MSKLLLKNLNGIKNLTLEQFESLFKISEALNTVVYEEVLLESVLDFIIRVINAERGIVVKHNPENSDFTIVSARNVNKESITDISEFSSGLLQQVVGSRKSLIYHDAQTDPDISQFESVQIKNIKSVVGVPIISMDKIWGVILADSQTDRREFTEENLVFLNFFSNLVSLALDKIIKLEKLEDENQRLSSIVEQTNLFPNLIGESKKMKELSSLITKVSRTDATVLLLGESGTGKDIVAQTIHNVSKREPNSFIAQFCGSIPDNLLESELFGYKTGAFTGANTDKKGLLEVAEAGTFFLDEIGEISSSIQAKLLRVIENREIIRLGDTKVRKIDIRLIAATNRDLQKSVKDGEFREDLFYRLNVFPIIVPPLRERDGDIVLLTKHFLNKMMDGNYKLEKSALTKLEGYHWPGNVRQLINVLERASILTENNTIAIEHIVLETENDESEFSGSLKEYEKLLLQKRLTVFKGNRTRAAESLEVSLRWVQMKCKEYDL